MRSGHFKWRTFVNWPKLGRPGFGYELTAWLKAKFSPVPIHRRQEIGKQSHAIRNETCDVGVSEGKRVSAIKPPAKREATTADKHFRCDFHPVHAQHRCTLAQLRKPDTGSPRERARPGSSLNHDGIAPMFPNPATVSGTMPPAVSGPLSVHTSGNTAPCLRALPARAGSAGNGSAHSSEDESRPNASPVPVDSSTSVFSPTVLHRYVIPVRRIPVWFP